MTFTASLDIMGDQEVRALLAGINLGLENLTTLHEWYVIAAQDHAIQNWPKGPPLSPLTRKARPNGGSRPLIDTGRLWQALGGQSSGRLSNAEGSLSSATPQRGRFGVSHPGATTHQFGAIITVKRAKFLTIPMSPEMSKHFRLGRKVRAFPKDLVPLRLKKREGYVLVEKSRRRKNRGGQSQRLGKAHVLLVKSTKIRKRPPLPPIPDLLPALQDATDRYLGLLFAGKRP